MVVLIVAGIDPQSLSLVAPAPETVEAPVAVGTVEEIVT